MKIKCIKDVVMNSSKKETAYFSGKIYEATEKERDMRAEDEQGDEMHWISGPGDKWFNEHFEVVGREATRATEISFPILNNLTPTTESCTAKVLEEVGELFRLIGKGQGQSGEKIEVMEQGYLATNMIAEALDVAQSAVTMAHTLATEHDINLEAMMEAHAMKLRNRGYLK